MDSFHSDLYKRGRENSVPNYFLKVNTKDIESDVWQSFLQRRYAQFVQKIAASEMTWLIT